MSLEIFARQSLAQFCIIYGEIFDDKAIKPDELETLMWGRMCAKDAGITKVGFKIPYDNIKRAKVTLPYMPDNITYTGCSAIKKNGGLYTPCCGKIAEDSYYCKSCSLDKEGAVKELEFGSIDTREQNIEDERFAPITFAEWMKGHKTALPEVYAKLRDAGIALEIPTPELVCRELPKRRKGRPAKSDDSVVDEDSVPKKGKKASPAASEDEAPKKAKKAEKPKAEKKAKALKSESESESESEDEAPKPKKAEKAKKASPAASEDEAPKSKKAEKAKAEKAEKSKKPKANSPAASEDEAPKKAKKAEKAKAKSDSDDEAPKALNATAALEELAAQLDEDEEEMEDQEVEIGGNDYILRNGKFICDKEDGRILGTINDEGDADWTEEP